MQIQMAAFELAMQMCAFLLTFYIAYVTFVLCEERHLYFYKNNSNLAAKLKKNNLY
jgi:hypothetical protein